MDQKVYMDTKLDLTFSVMHGDKKGVKDYCCHMHNVLRYLMGESLIWVTKASGLWFSTISSLKIKRNGMWPVSCLHWKVFITRNIWWLIQADRSTCSLTSINSPLLLCPVSKEYRISRRTEVCPKAHSFHINMRVTKKNDKKAFTNPKIFWNSDNL